MKQISKNIIAFITMFIFVQLCGAYIMGGFYSQTITSKTLSTFLGFLLGILVIAMLHNFKEEQ